MLLINEIFASIDGEGIRTGYPVTFIRSYGCNLKCQYCDTLYAVDPETEEDKAKAFKMMSVEDVVSECKKLKNKRITFTGGEPLIQKEADQLVCSLLENGFEVNIETNGAVDIVKFNDKLIELLTKTNKTDILPLLDSKLIYTLDYKCACSGMEEQMIMSNFAFLKPKDVLKFVLSCESELQKMKSIVEEYKPNCSIFISPVFGDIEPKQLVEFVLEHDLQNVRVQVQLHKIIWPPTMRGV